jgi:hypothetical protein
LCIMHCLRYISYMRVSCTPIFMQIGWLICDFIFNLSCNGRCWTWKPWNKELNMLIYSLIGQ